MPNVIFWGHGLWNPSDGYAVVPQGSMLFFFARSREENTEDRMHNIAYRVTESIERGISWMNNTDFGNIRTGDALRSIKIGGDRVKNYRLTYPHGLGWPKNDNETSDGHWNWYDQNAPNRIVYTNDPYGDTLQFLMDRHAQVGTKFLWLPCRATLGVPSRVEGVNYQRQSPYLRPPRRGNGDEKLNRRPGAARGSVTPGSTSWEI